LALEMIQADFEAGVEFGWVGGDGLYGHGLEFANALNAIDLSFLLDVHCNLNIDACKPQIAVPERTSPRGRKPTQRQTDIAPVQIERYAKQRSHPQHWHTVTLRQGTKGPLRLSMPMARVWRCGPIGSRN